MSTTLTWANPAGGDFNTAGNWTPVQSPGTADTVDFQAGTLTSGNYFPYTYTVTGNATVATFIDRGDDVTFTGTLTSTATSSDAIGMAVDEGTMTIAAGAAFTFANPATFSNVLVIVGFNSTAGSVSSIYANAQLTIAGSVTIGNLEVGEGSGNDFAATLLVTGPAAQLDVTSGFLTPLGFSIGHEGTLEIENGATVQSAGGDVGSFQYGGAAALLTGPGSEWNIGSAETLSVGYQDGADFTPSVLTVSNGASLTGTGATFVFGQYGTLALDDSAVIAGVIELDGGAIEALAAAGQAVPQTITLGTTISIDASATSTLLESAQVGFDITGPLAGSGTLTIGPGGTVEIAGAQSGFTGSVVIDDSAVLRLDTATTLGSGPITFQTATGDALDNAGTLLLAGGQTLTNALSLASGIGVLQIGHGDTFTLENSVSGAGTLALAGGTFVLTDPATELPSGGLVLQAATVVLDAGSSSFDIPISFADLGGSTLIWNAATAPAISSAGTPTIAMFAGDTIAFPDLTFTTYDINSGGTVALIGNSGTVSTFVLTGATGDLRVVPFSYGGSSGDALVADAEWANAAGGTFDIATNWQNGFVPGSTDIAFIGQGVTTPYTITGGGTVAAMQVAFDPVSLTGSYDLLGSPSSDPTFTPLQVAQGADLSIAANGTVTAPGVLVGPGRSTLDVLGTLTAGTAEVDQGGSLLIDGGQVSLTGAAGLSLGLIPNELPPAALVISDGGSLTDAAAGLALVTGMAAALVTGPASTWTTAGTVYLGSLSSAAATATLTVQNSATVSAADVNLVENGTLDLSPTAHLDGPITTGFGNGGAVNRIGAVADPGQSGTATTTLANAISLDGGDLTLAGGAGTTLDITGSLSGNAFLDVVGHVVLADSANSFSANEGLGASELPFAIGGEAHLGTAGQSGTLEEAATGAFGTNTVSFASGSDNTLIIDAGVSADNTLSGFSLGDTIDLRGLAFETGASVNVNGTTVTVTSGAASVTLDMVNIQAGAPLVVSSDGEGATPGTDIAVLCFLAGTLIRTPQGERPVEALAVGDEVLTWGGEVQPITWIGQGRVLATRGRRTAATPVIVRRGALGDNCPAADLRVTKGHAFLIDGALVPAEYLVNHRSIVWDDHAQEVHLYHLELPRHDVLVANGAPAESYRDDGNRWLFANANSGWTQPEKPPYAPVLTGGALVDAAWRRLLRRAGGVRPLPLTGEADLHLLADGKRIDGARAADGAWTFRLTAVPSVLRIVSHCGAPDQLGLARDARELGVALRAITLRQGAACRRIAADEARLTDGFHAFEAAAGFRWTDGNAGVPADLLAGWAGPLTLTLDVAMTAQYPAIPALSRAA